jgi:tetratricopeptide (TPR) repeat protein
MTSNPGNSLHPHLSQPLYGFIMLCLVPVFFAAPVLSARSYPDSSRIGYFRSVQQLLFNDRFVEADSLNDVYIRDYPADPAGYLFKASVRLAVMTDSEENLFEEEFKQLLDTVMVLSEAVMDTGGPEVSAWMALCRGHAHTYASLWESRFGSAINAIKRGYRARGEYELGLAFDSSLTDLYMGLGAFHYWKSAKAGILRQLRLFRNDKDRGIAELRTAAESSLISSESARNALIWIWLDMKEFDSAIVACREMLQKYPDGRLFLWPLAQAYYLTENWVASAESYTRLREFLSLQAGNYFNLVECDYYLMRCYDRAGVPDRAKATAAEFLKYESLMPEKTKGRQSSKIAALKQAAR